MTVIRAPLAGIPVPAKRLPTFNPVVLFRVIVLASGAPPDTKVLLTGLFVSWLVIVKLVAPTTK